MQKGLGQIIGCARRFCGGLRVTQVDNFVRLCTAVFLARTRVLSRLALVFEGPQRHAHRLKRLWRFLSNPRFPAQAVMDQIALHNLAAALRVGARKVVLVDVTKVTDQLGLLAARIPQRDALVPHASPVRRHLTLAACVPSPDHASQRGRVGQSRRQAGRTGHATPLPPSLSGALPQHPHPRHVSPPESSLRRFRSSC